MYFISCKLLPLPRNPYEDRNRIQDRGFNRRLIPFNLSSFNIEGSLEGCASYASSTDMKRTLPLIMFMLRPLFLLGYLLILITIGQKQSRKYKWCTWSHTIPSGPGDFSIWTELCPGQLYCLCCYHEGDCYSICQGKFFCFYVHDLMGRGTPRNPFELEFSQPYNLLRREDREVFMKVY